MEPQYRFEPLLENWVNWEWSHIPNGSALLQSSQQLTKQSMELSLQMADLSLRSSVNVLQTFCSAANLLQQAWLNSAVALSGAKDVADRAEKPERDSAPGAAAETRNDWNAADVDAALTSHAA